MNAVRIISPRVSPNHTAPYYHGGVVYVRKGGEDAAHACEPKELAAEGGSVAVHADTLISRGAEGPFAPLAVSLEQDVALRDAFARAIPVPSLVAWSRVRLVVLGLAMVPLLMLLEAVLLLGVGLFLSALTVHFRDVKDLLQTVLSVLFFATPILYSLPDLPKGRMTGLLALNPLAPLFSGWHDAFFYGRFSPPGTWGAAAAVSLAAFAIGWAFFGRLRDSFPEAV